MCDAQLEHTFASESIIGDSVLFVGLLMHIGNQNTPSFYSCGEIVLSQTMVALFEDTGGAHCIAPLSADLCSLAADSSACAMGESGYFVLLQCPRVDRTVYRFGTAACGGSASTGPSVTGPHILHTTVRTKNTKERVSFFGYASGSTSLWLQRTCCRDFSSISEPYARRRCCFTELIDIPGPVQYSHGTYTQSFLHS